MATKPPHDRGHEPPRSPAADRDPTVWRDPADPELLEQIVADFTKRLRRGQHPAIGDYQQQFPNLSDEIEELLSSVAMIEQLKGESDPTPNNRKLLDRVSQLSQIGSYKIIREVGRGGMGVVFEAIHESLGRRVAIKVMPTPLVNGEKYVERFKREAQSAARLHHTNIVSVFGVGEKDGLHYYVMDFVDGQSLSEIVFGLNRRTGDTTRNGNDSTKMDARLGGSCQSDTASENNDFELALPRPSVAEDVASNPTGESGFAPRAQDPSAVYQRDAATLATLDAHDPKHFRWAARIGASVADALTYAHDQRILHRDIKPSNIMLDRKGIVWVTDFGLAKDNSCDLNLTRTGDVIGTPQYLAPESLEGKYDQRSETYCLGLTLYELVTLRPAYAPGSPGEVIRAIATSSPVSPRKINPQVPLDLSTIIDKAVSRDPQQRYQTAEELHSDLLAFTEDRPIAARRPNLLETAIRWSRRNPLPAALSVVSAVLLTLVAVVASIGYLSTIAALDQEAEKSARLTIQQLATDRARKDAEKNLAAMQAQYDRAEANIAVTLDAFDQMFKQVIGGGSSPVAELDIDGFREVSGIETSLTKADAAFLENLLTFYEDFATLNADNEKLTSESAKAFRRVGNIYQLVGQMPDAIEAYQNSIKLYKTTWDADPDSKENLLTQIRIQNELSSALRKNGNAPQAHALSRLSVKQLEESPLADTDNEVRLELARTLSATGFNLFQYVAGGKPVAGNHPKMPPAMGGTSPRNGRGQFEWPGRGGPNRDAESSQNRPRPFSWGELIGGGRSAMERRNRQLIEQAIEIIDQLLAEDSENEEYLSVRATCFSVMAAAEMDRDRDAAVADRARAIEAFQALVDQNPDQAEFRYSLALAYSVHGNPPQAEDILLLRKSIEQTEILIEQHAERMEYHQLLANLKIKTAGLYLFKQQPDEAFENLTDAKSSIDFLLERTPSGQSFGQTIRALSYQSDRVAQLYREQGDPKKALKANQLTRQLRDIRTKVSPWLRRREPQNSPAEN